MTFNVMVIGRPDDPEMAAFPSIGPDLQLMSEPLDGPSPILFAATGFRVQRFNSKRKKFDKVTEAEKLSIECRVTASRVVMYCRKFDKGGGWWGDPASMLVLNVGSKLMAAARRHGKALVGHLRYPWIGSVYFHPKTGMLGSEFLRFGFKDSSDDEPVVCLLDIVLHRGENASRLAWEIAQRAIAYRYTSGEELDDSERAGFEEIRRAGLRADVDPDGSGFGTYSFPSSFPAPGGGVSTMPGSPPPLLSAISPGGGALMAASQPPAPAADLVPPSSPAATDVVPPPPLPPPPPPPPGDVGVRLRFDTGEVVAGPGLVIVGRDPARSVPGDEIAQLLAIADPSHSISKTHMSLQVRDRSVSVIDRFSTNGVAIVADGAVAACAPGEPIEVPIGAVVRFGERSVVVSVGPVSGGAQQEALELAEQTRRAGGGR